MAKTLKDLATELGLSQTTVSRALNGFPEVNEATRRRVHDAAERFNYRPSARARSLATGRTMTIAHVLTFSKHHEMMNPVYGDFIAGASEAYQQAGYHIHLAVVADSDQEQAFRNLAAERSVDGVLLQAPLTGDFRIPLLQEIGMPFVVHGRASIDGDTDYSWVDVNNKSAFEQATNGLLDLGHRRIGLINGLESMDFARRRKEGMLAALAARGVDPCPEFYASNDMTESVGHEETSRMLSMPNPPTAFLASSFIAAMGVRRAIVEAGLTLGRDVSLVTHDDDLSYLKNGSAQPIFTATRSSVRDAGRIAAQILLSQIRSGDASPVTRLLEVDYIEGPSTGVCPSEPSVLEPVQAG
ncbi:MAG: substrate-binding domain-containing protein [Pseudomonadota bacterium]